MRVCTVFLVLCVLTGEFTNGELDSEVEYELRESCASIAENAATHTDSIQACISQEMDVANSPEEEAVCLEEIKSTCEREFKYKDDCSAGMKLAKDKRCGVAKTDIGKTCCEECSLGRLSGESQGKYACGSNSPTEYLSLSTILRKKAYFACCLEAAETPETTTEKKVTTTTEKKIETTTEKKTTSTTKKPRERCTPKSCEQGCNDEGERIVCSCRPGFRLKADKKSCKDINECAESTDDLCLQEGTVCHNTPGSYKCVPIKKRDTGLSCPAGFKRNVENQVCDDINECQLPRPPCPKYLCENTIGGYKCAGKPGKPVTEASPGATTEPEVTSPKNDICPPGFRVGDNDECVDIEECEERLDDCQRLSQYCINTHGSYFCQDHVSRRCSPGFKVNVGTGVCEDINECEESTEVCKRDEICINLPGAYNCKSKISTLPKLATKTCQEGTRVRPGGTICEDIDECREGSHLCDQFQNCINTFGGHECRCKSGFELDSVTASCTDIDECSLKLDNCGSGRYCLNVVGSFVCTRRPPTTSLPPTTTTTAPAYEYEYYDEDIPVEETNPKPLPTSSSTTTRRTTTSTSTTTSRPQQPYRPRANSPYPSRRPTTTSTTERADYIPPLPDLPPKPEDYPPRPYNYPARPDDYRPRPESTPYVPRRPTTTSTTPRVDFIPPLPELPPRPDDYPARPDEPKPKPTPYIPRRPETTTSTTQKPDPYTPTRPEPSPYIPRRPESPIRPSNRRPNTNRRPTTPAIVNIPTPTNPETIEKEKDPDGTYDINTVDIPKDRWTNVIGKEGSEEKNFYEGCINGFESGPDGSCVDINECENGRHICTNLEVCVNRPGGYTCNCMAGFRRDSTGWCVAMNTPRYTTTPKTSTTSTTARTTTSTTTVKPATEVSTPEWPHRGYGGRGRPYSPGPTIPCELGYNFDRTFGRCIDVDECATNKDTCAQNEDCVNIPGGYRCVCGGRCRTDFSHYTPSYVLPTSPESEDTNVITVGSQFGQRGPRLLRPTYVRQSDAVAYRASCPWGYSLASSNQCFDIDECATNVHKCGPQQQCENFNGGYACQCPAGHKLVGRDTCEDIDECKQARNPCMAECINTVGSFRCACGEGFRNPPSNQQLCVDVDECAEQPGLCEQECSNVWGGFRCYCRRGYRLHTDNRTCVDIDECSEWSSGRHRGRLCGGECVNVPGTYRCSCPAGYRLSEDGRSCIDIDECETGEASCAHSRDPGSVCQNTRGSYHCHQIDCPRGYRLDSRHRCTRIQRQCLISDMDCLRQPSTYSYNFITFTAHIYMPSGSVDLFTMHGPDWSSSVVTFEMRLVGVKAPPNVAPAELNCFDMRPMNNICVVSLLCSLDGPQVAELELTMSLHTRGQFAGSAVARLIIIVSQYDY